MASEMVDVKCVLKRALPLSAIAAAGINAVLHAVVTRALDLPLFVAQGPEEAGGGCRPRPGSGAKRPVGDVGRAQGPRPGGRWGTSAEPKARGARALRLQGAPCPHPGTPWAHQGDPWASLPTRGVGLQH